MGVTVIYDYSCNLESYISVDMFLTYKLNKEFTTWDTK